MDYEEELRAVDEPKAIAPRGMTMSWFAIRWILVSGAVSCVIPGAKRPDQVEESCRAADFPRIPGPTMRRVREICQKRVMTAVHPRW